ncbi:MAG: TonB-dependent receptor [Gammaproteobacteria bacterium]
MIRRLRKTFSPGVAALVCLWIGSATNALADSKNEARSLEPITVTATGRAAPMANLAGNAARIDSDEIRLVGATHISELLFRAPGAWIVRGSGQEHLTALRSPVLTGAGACGAFLFLEDGVPIRPAGFCNVNELMEINTEQAEAVEVIRGPGTALYGSNALHGTINSINPRAEQVSNHLAMETGSWDYYRGRFGGALSARGQEFYGWGHVEHDGGYRDDSGYDQAKLNLAWEGWGQGVDTRSLFSGTRLRQDTAGFIFGKDAYKSSDARKSNPVAGAFRDVDSLRLISDISLPLASDTEFQLRPFLRNSYMEFTQHFLPGVPEEENGQTSGGLQMALRQGDGDSGLLVGGLDLEYMDGFLEEVQDDPIESGSDFLRETRPAGKHYDYDVTSWLVAPYIHWEKALSHRLRISAGLRFEYLRYDYDNRMLDGNTRDDGTECGFGGCLFNRPADRDDDFHEWAPKLGFVHRPGKSWEWYGSAARGFRFPQATELYRLQRQQDVADLDPEQLDSLEFGTRGARGPVSWDLSAFYMEKKNFIFRDANGINVSDGETRHLGLEYLFGWNIAPTLSLTLSGTMARHTYRFDRAAGGGETIAKGDDVDTAPRRLNNLRLNWELSPSGQAEVEWVSMGSYYMDAANTVKYGGHNLLNLRFRQSITQRWQASIRLTNLLDTTYAERADFAFGNYRYIPGRERAVFVEIGVRGL